MAAALATLEALEERGEAFYEELAARGERLRRGVEERFRAAGIPVECTGRGSLFMTHVLREGEAGLLSPADIAAKTRGEVKDRELRIALLNRGVFAVHGGGALSEAHGDADVEELLDAYEAAADDLRRELA
jgi:glutamate-1-semialdehyde 2,1-aminomutase